MTKKVGIFCTALCLCLGGYAWAADTIAKIAVVTSLSSTASAQSRELLATVQMAVDEANAAGSLPPGMKLQLVQEDDQADPKVAQQIAGKLGADPQVLCVIGHAKAEPALAASATYAESGLSLVDPFVTDNRLTARGLNNVFRLCESDERQGREAADFVVKILRRKKVVILQDASDYGKALAESFRAELRDKGLRELSCQQMKEGDAQNTPFLNRLRGFGPNLVYFAGAAQQAADLQQGIQKIKLQVSFMGGEKLLSNQYLSEADDAAMGTIVSFYAPDLRKTRLSSVVEFRRAYIQQNKTNYSFYAPSAYDAAELVLDALKRAGKAERAALRQALAATADYRGLVGGVEFNDKGDNRLAKTYFYVASRNPKNRKIGFVFYQQLE